MEQQLLAHGADLRLRLVQAQALVSMLSMRPFLLLRLLPLLREAVDLPPAVEREQKAPIPVAQEVKNVPAGLHMKDLSIYQEFPPATIRVLDPSKYLSDEIKEVSERRLEVLQELADGGTEIEIGKRLNIAPNTVGSHKNWLFHHFHVHDKAALIALAFRKGMID